MNDTNRRRTVLITGVTGGIGGATALRFAKAGWNVLAHYHSSEGDAKRIKRSIGRLGGSCEIMKSDLSSRTQLEKFAKRCQKLDIDALVNCAGTYSVSKHFSELTAEDMTGTFMVNAFAPFLLSSAVFKRMANKRFGRIVNISSIAAKYGGSAYSMHYGCSKLALEGITRTLAREGAENNILVNTVRPGVIDTSFHKKFPKDMAKRIAMIPVKKMGKPEDVAEMIYYLGSEKNNFITNETITVAGGE